tara:strand:+ start:693 stop:1283 length:591 start_codon:yes stop_codon:yes gene_type:complete
MKTKEIEISKLKPAEYNPRQISKKQYNDLKQSVEKFGLVDPIILNKDMTVIGGHQRLKVCKDLNYDKISCVVLDLSKEQERELNIRLNKSGGEFDMDALANYFDIEELTDWGFKHVELGLNIDKIDEEPEIEFSEYLDESHNYVVLLFDNDVDWLSAQTHFDLKSVYSKRANGKPWSKGIGRVINGASYLNKLKNG